MKYAEYYFEFPQLLLIFRRVTHLYRKRPHLLVPTLLIPVAHVCYLQFLQTKVIYSEESFLVSVVLLNVVSQTGVCQPEAIFSVILVCQCSYKAQYSALKPQR